MDLIEKVKKLENIVLTRLGLNFVKLVDKFEICGGYEVEFHATKVILEDSGGDYEKKSNEIKEPIIFIHSLHRTNMMWFKLMKVLSEASDDFCCSAVLRKRDYFLIDLPGFGKSTCPEDFFKPDNGRWNEILMTDLIQMWKNKNIGDQMKVHLIGFGVGTYIGSAYALRFPASVSSIYMLHPWGIMEKECFKQDLQKPFEIKDQLENSSTDQKEIMHIKHNKHLYIDVFRNDELYKFYKWSQRSGYSRK